MAVMQPDEASAEPPGCETIEELFAALESPLLSYALRLVGELSVAEDMVQEAFMKLQAQFEKEGAATDGIIINPGALSHYSLALADALRGSGKPVVEVHISNVFARDLERHRMVTAASARGVISGLGFDGYLAALEYFGRQRRGREE